eukprot:scaffold118944_cov18-Tisochrysis_lutea.AAC.2
MLRNARASMQVQQLRGVYEVLTGDMLLAAAFVSYAGPFTSRFRAGLIEDWIKFLKERQMPMTQGINDPLKVSKAVGILLVLHWGVDAALVAVPHALGMSVANRADTALVAVPHACRASVLQNLPIPACLGENVVLSAVLVDDAMVASWVREGLPSDPTSIQNGTILTNSERWALMMDPQLQGIVWIKERESKNSLQACMDREARAQVLIGARDFLTVLACRLCCKTRCGAVRECVRLPHAAAGHVEGMSDGGCTGT